MKEYLKTMQRVIDEGELYPDRTGAGRYSIFGVTETYDLTGNILPLVTTRHIFRKPLLKELFGMIAGSKKAEDLGETFWGRWSPDTNTVIEHGKSFFEGMEMKEDDLKVLETGAKEHPLIGTIGPMYGVLWRYWPLVGGVGDFTWIKGVEDIASDAYKQLSQDFDRVLVMSNGQMKNDQATRDTFIGDQYVKQLDQLQKLFLGLKRNPYSTHHRLTAFNPALIGPHADPRKNVLDGYGALSPCHPLSQFHVRGKEGDFTLDCSLYMGSSDVCLGRPYNIAFYSLLSMLLAHCLGYKVGKFHFFSGNTHIYANHMEDAKKQVKLTPYENKTVITINPDCKDLFALKAEDISFGEYDHHPRIDYIANV